MTQTGNPYRWDHHTPGISIDRTPDFVDAIRRGEVVRLVGGRGMGKSVTLRQIASRFEREPDARVLLIPGPPLRAGEPSDFLADAARRLTLDPHRFETIRASRGPISRAELQRACAGDGFVLDLHQAVELLQGAGLVDLQGPVSSDPVDINGGGFDS